MTVEPALSGTVRQTAKIQSGLATEKAKEITKAIKESMKQLPGEKDCIAKALDSKTALAIAAVVASVLLTVVAIAGLRAGTSTALLAALAREAGGVNPGRGRIRMALVADTAECLEAAHRIAQFARSRAPARPPA